MNREEDLSLKESEALKEALEKISPLIEKYTGAVCPGCVKVCCAARHGRPEKEDILFFESIGYEWKSSPGADDAPCGFMGPRGCVLERWQRPFRCTWYFCEPLLAHIKSGKAREYRSLVKELGRLVGIRREFLENNGGSP